jgi:hypothetical protein
MVVGSVAQDGTELALKGATIQVRGDSSESWAQSTVADSLGGFMLLLPPGSYELRARVIGHRAGTSRVQLKSGTVDTVRLALSFYVCHGY